MAAHLIDGIWALRWWLLVAGALLVLTPLWDAHQGGRR